MARTIDNAGKAAKKHTSIAVKKDVSESVSTRNGKTKASAQLTTPPPTKAELVRDSFTIPKDEYLVLSALKDRAAHLRRPTKKSELLRAGIGVLQGLSDRAFLAAITKVPSLKTGRPKESPKEISGR